MHIHPQLLADCHLLGTLDDNTLLLHRNAGLPWFILVPATEQADVLDLSGEQRAAVLQCCAEVSRFIKQNLGYNKVNFAGLGNVVPQQHLHIVGRREDDPCWPQPVWGNLPSGPDYATETLHHWVELLQRECGLCATV